jgi:hypothetical protein
VSNRLVQVKPSASMLASLAIEVSSSRGAIDTEVEPTPGRVGSGSARLTTIPKPLPSDVLMDLPLVSLKQ